MSGVKDFFASLWQTHRGRIVGVALALAVGVMFLVLGFFKTLFLLALMSGGYILGGKVDNKEDLLELLDRILPPGYHK
ncbi:MAG: DUF2273 domain-containing protein [Acidaminococcales bacterium]|nr:DUF2273 domain-containing protein [Acidaminococcales bacterium]